MSCNNSAGEINIENHFVGNRLKAFRDQFHLKKIYVCRVIAPGIDNVGPTKGLVASFCTLFPIIANIPEIVTACFNANSSLKIYFLIDVNMHQ